MTTLNNLAQSTREALIDSLQKQAAGDEGTFVNIAGDTMTGNLEVPTTVVTGAATITGPTRFVNLVTAGTVVVTGAASIAGPSRFTNIVTAGNLALTSAASLLGPLNVNGIITSTGPINSTGTLSLTGIMRADSNATLASPMILGFGSLIGGSTVAPLVVIASGASQSILDFRGALISTASINLAANKTIGYLKVQLNDNSGYIPVFIGIGS